MSTHTRVPLHTVVAGSLRSSSGEREQATLAERNVCSHGRCSHVSSGSSESAIAASDRSWFVLEAKTSDFHRLFPWRSASHRTHNTCPSHPAASPAEIFPFSTPRALIPVGPLR